MKISAKQTQVIERLEESFINFLPKKSLFLRKSKPETLGTYIYGNVGAGKTFVMQRFFDKTNIQAKQFIHYQQLIKTIHQYNAHHSSDKSQRIAIFAKEYYKDIKLLCIDEVEIKDPADTAIIYNLLNALKKQTFVVFSSNFHPADFAKNILNAGLVTPLIKLLTREFDVLHLTSEQDYRKANSSKASGRIIFPDNAANRDVFLTNIAKLTSNYAKSSTTLENFGRKITFDQTYGPILQSDFNQLCRQDLSYSDYITICQKFDVIIINDIPLLNSNDVATRFINLIDNIYFYRKLLFALMADSPEKLYAQKARELEYSRTVSRIIEMNDQLYQT